MKVNEKQLIMLIRVLEGSFRIADRADMNIFGYNTQIRRELYNTLMNQQSEELNIDDSKTD